jgi:hypothetical protein
MSYRRFRTLSSIVIAFATLSLHALAQQQIRLSF